MNDLDYVHRIVTELNRCALFCEKSTFRKTLKAFQNWLGQNEARLLFTPAERGQWATIYAEVGAYRITSGGSLRWDEELAKRLQREHDQLLRKGTRREENDDGKRAGRAVRNANRRRNFNTTRLYEEKRND